MENLHREAQHPLLVQRIGGLVPAAARREGRDKVSQVDRDRCLALRVHAGECGGINGHPDHRKRGERSDHSRKMSCPAGSCYDHANPPGVGIFAVVKESKVFSNVCLKTSSPSLLVKVK